MEWFYADGKHRFTTGESPVAFMPIVDLKANDETCISSKTHFIAGQSKKYNADPILTFDQPLYQKNV